MTHLSWNDEITEIEYQNNKLVENNQLLSLCDNPIEMIDLYKMLNHFNNCEEYNYNNACIHACIKINNNYTCDLI